MAQTHKVKTTGKKLAARAKTVARDLADEHFLPTRKELSTMAHEKGRQIRAYIDHQSERVEDMRDEVEDRIVAHPFESVAIAAGVGFVIGLLLRRV